MFSRYLNIKTLSFLAKPLLFFSILVLPAYSIPFISKETELSMGRSADKEVVQQFGIYQDKSLQLYVNKIGQNVVSKLVNKEFHLLNDYLFCFHKNFDNPQIINRLKYTKGLKYFLDGFNHSQEKIKKFIQKCKSLENSKGYLSQNFFEAHINSRYKFSSGAFIDMIFKIIDLQKNKINILLGNIKTTINKDEFLFNPL